MLLSEYIVSSRVRLSLIRRMGSEKFNGGFCRLSALHSPVKISLFAILLGNVEIVEILLTNESVLVSSAEGELQPASNIPIKIITKAIFLITIFKLMAQILQPPDQLSNFN